MYGPPEGYGQMPPGPPGMFGSTMQGMGYGTNQGQMYSQMQQGQQQGGMLFAGGVGQFATQTAPALGMGAMMMGSMVAGPLMTAGGRSSLTRGVGRGLQMMDPFSWVMGNPQAISDTGKMGFAGAGYRMGAGMAGRMGGGMMARGAMGVMGGVGMAAAPLIGAMAAMEAPMWAGRQAWKGATNAMAGQSLMSQIGGSVAPGQQMGVSQGAAMGKTLHEVGRMLGTDTETTAGYARELDTQKVFQTTKNAKEFREKFKKVMKAVKEIAQISQGTVDDAMKTFAELRQQGFYTTADIKAQAASTAAREMTTGMSGGVLAAVRAAGSQTARAYGMRGRFGASLAEREAAGVAMGVRSGAMSEEEVLERGGAAAVGLRMAQQQMAFLSSSKGTAITAHLMGKGGAPDADRMRRFLQGGDSLETIVTGAASRGPSGIRQAQTRESKEAMLKYAGMAEIMMAAAQQKQIYGYTSRSGIIGMMGKGQQEGEIQLQHYLGMPEQQRKERQQKSFAMQQGEYESRRRSEGITGRMGAAASRMAEPFRNFGGDMIEELSNTYASAAEGLVGGAVTTGGDDVGRRERRKRINRGETVSSGVSGRHAGGGTLLGPSSATDKIRDRYSGFSHDESKLRKHMGADYDKAVRDGEVIELGQGKVIRKEDLQRADKAASGPAGIAGQVGGEEKAKLGLSMSSGDFMQRLRESRGKSGMAMGAVGVMALDPFTRIGETSRRLRKEHGTFFGAQEMGLIGIDKTFEDYMKGDVVIGAVGTEGTTMSGAEGRLGLDKVVGEEYKKAEGPQSERIRSLVRGGRGGLEQTRNIDSVREAMKEAIGGVVGGATNGLFSGRGALTDKLQKSGKVRRAVSDYIRILTDKNSSAAALQQAEKRVEKAVDGDKAAMKALRSMRAQVKKFGRGGPFSEDLRKQGAAMGELSGELGTLEMAENDREAEGERLATASEGSDLSDSVKAAIGEVSSAKGAERGIALRDLMREMSEGGFSEDEMKIIEQLGAGGGGAEVGGLLQQMTGGGDKGMKAAGETLTSLGVDPKKLESLKGLKGEKRAKAALAILEGEGIDADTMPSSEGAKTIEGIQKEYVDANDQFVRTVAAFVAALGDAGITLKDGKDLHKAVKGMEEAAAGVPE